MLGLSNNDGGNMKKQRTKTKYLGLKLAASIVFGVTMLSSGVQAQSAKEQSCAILKGFLESGGSGGAKAVYAITTHWREQDRAKIFPNLSPSFERFKYYSGSVYLVDDFGAQYKEHLIVMDAGPLSTIFLRIRYAGHKGNMLFMNVDFNSKYPKIAKYPFAQKPAKLDCN